MDVANAIKFEVHRCQAKNPCKCGRCNAEGWDFIWNQKRPVRMDLYRDNIERLHLTMVQFKRLGEGVTRIDFLADNLIAN